MTMQTSLVPAARERWWQGVTRYQWLVLAIASAGRVFDVFEGQIFGSCMNEALPDLLRDSGLGNWPRPARIWFLQGEPLHLSLPQAMLLLGCLFLIGACVLFFAPETRGQPLPE